MLFEFRYNFIMIEFYCMKKFDNEEGQTTIEYVLILSLVVVVGVVVWNKFGNFTQDVYGNFNETLSKSLTTGVCAQDCFFQGYENAKK